MENQHLDEDESSESEGGKSEMPQKLVCVEYPGLVQNPEAMIETLGGKSALAKAFNDTSRRLELRFRPQDIFSKPTCSERSNTTSLLVKVTRFRRNRKKCCCDCPKHGTLKNSNNSDNSSKKVCTTHVPHKLQTEILGSIKTTFSFPNMSDFQYLPTERIFSTERNEGDPCKSDGKGRIESGEMKSFTTKDDVLHRPIMDEVHFGQECLPGADWLSITGPTKAPLFLPPAAFTRMDQPQDYHYRKDTSSQAIKSNLSVPQTIIGRTRQRRTLHAVFVNYETPMVPERASDVALHQLKVKFIDEKVKDEVYEAFQRQPIWTKTGLSEITGQSLDKLKFILPTVAYYFTSGPWRNQWVRFGYDPRKDPESAIYQTLDYRVRLEGGAKHKVQAKRSYANYILPYQSNNPSKSRTSTIIREALVGSNHERQTNSNNSFASEQEKAIKRSHYMFEEGVIPPCRQMFYQYKDIKFKEAENLIKSRKRTSTDIEYDKQCDERNGWYQAGIDSALREMMTKSITRSLTSNLKGDRRSNSSITKCENEKVGCDEGPIGADESQSIDMEDSKAIGDV